VEAIQTILTALEQNDYVTDIVKVMEDGVEVGYSITFAKGGTVTIYHGTDGSDGKDGAAPQISIKKAQDGEYYWTADGEWMTDENGEMIPAVVADDPDGEYITPLFRVADGKWYVSVDNGNSWEEINNPGHIDEEDSESESEADSVFSKVDTSNEEYVIFTLSDGTQFKIPRYQKSKNYWYGKKMIWNGDSISYGSWLASPDTDTYPFLVGKALGMDTYNFAIGGSYAAKPKGSFEKYYWDYNEWMKAIENGDLDTSKKYLVKDYVNSKKPCRIYYFDGSQWKANSETGGWALVERVKEMVAVHPDADVIGIAIGTNDFYTGACPFGEIDAASYRNLEELRKQITFNQSVNLVELGESIGDMKLLKPEYALAESPDFYVVLDIPITSGKKYQATSGYRSWFLDSEKQPLSTINLKDQGHIFTAPAGAHYISISFSGEIGSGAVYQENETDGGISEEEMTLTHSTFCGAIHTICKYLLDNYKNKDIVFITPIKRYQGWCKYPEDKNSLGYTLKDYSDAIIEICSYYSIPVIDFYSTSGLNPHIDTSLFGDTDGKAVHPNEEGHRRMASLVIGYLQNLRQ
jgi:lysophospholipase L1-like esterase